MRVSLHRPDQTRPNSRSKNSSCLLRRHRFLSARPSRLKLKGPFELTDWSPSAAPAELANRDSRSKLREKCPIRDCFHVAFADISACKSYAELEARTARALGLNGEGALTERTLLVMDGAEQVAKECGRLLAELMSGATELHVLCTSRVALRLREEHVIALAPLRLTEGSSNSVSSTSEAVAFFLECAKRVAPTSHLNQHNLGVLAELCRRLDGLPLALELAAVRLRTLPAQEIVDNLENQFSVLEAAADPQDRRTLKNVLDWSLQLLSGAEVTIFTRLGVFPSKWTLPAAQSICGFGAL